VRCIPVDREPESVLLHTHPGGSALMSKHLDRKAAGRPRFEGRYLKAADIMSHAHC
jgi:hypothetical protein